MSDSEGGWQEPHEDVSPWAPRDTGEADQAPGIGTPEAFPRGNGDQDTVAFGVPDREAGADDQGSYVQRGRDDMWYGTGGDQAGYQARADDEDDPDLPWYAGGSGDEAGSGGQPGSWGQRGPGDDGGQAGHGDDGDQGGYGQIGYGRYGQAGSGGSGGYDGGYGTAEWGLPTPPPPRRPGRGGRFLVYIAVAALAAGIGAGITVTMDNHNSVSPPGISSRDIPVPHDDSGLNPAKVEDKVEPGLVDITATLKYASETAEGTGMVISPDGLVLTNNHVIDGATSVSARLVVGGRHFAAQVIGYDSVDDVALLRLTGASGLATVSLGNSSQVKIGTAVLALGNAEGLGSVTPAAGTINGLDRSIQASDAGSNTTENLNHMLETNAQIQQGDSGGALANNTGQVIGMVTAANTGSGGQQGGPAGFAIPINSALAIARQIAAGQASSTVAIGLPGFLGVEVAQSNSPNPQQQAVDQQRAANGQGGSGDQGGGGLSCVGGGVQPGAPQQIAPAGVGTLVLGVLCGTAAQAGGLVPGDVITSVDGLAVTTPGSLTTITSRYHPRAVVSITWQSVDGAEHTLQFMLGNGPAR
jgi:S1-C subfamily serine protease